MGCFGNEVTKVMAASLSIQAIYLVMYVAKATACLPGHYLTACSRENSEPAHCKTTSWLASGNHESE